MTEAEDENDVGGNDDDGAEGNDDFDTEEDVDDDDEAVSSDGFSVGIDVLSISPDEDEITIGPECKLLLLPVCPPPAGLLDGVAMLLPAAGICLPLCVFDGPTVVVRIECNFSNKAEPLKLAARKLGGAAVVAACGAPVWVGSVAAVVHSLLMLSIKVINMKLVEVKLKLISCWILLW